MPSPLAMRLSLVALLLALSACASTAPPDGEGATVFVLVRHAEKQSSAADAGLTAAGTARAQALADALADTDVDLIVASQFRRAADTVVPLASRLGLDVETHALDLADSPRSAAEIARALAASHRGQTVVVSGHSNTIPAMVRALTGLDVPDLDEADYDNLFIVLHDGQRGRLIRSLYGAADAIP